MKTVRLSEYNDYKPFLPAGFTETAEGATIPADTYAWSSAYKALRINDVTKKGAISVGNFPKLKIGDTVKINAEVLNVSGVKAKIAIDYAGGVGNLFILQSEKIGEFEKIGGEFVITKENSFAVLVGVFTADVGDFYIRNVEIEVVNKGRGIEPDKRAYTFLFGASSLSLLSGYHPYSCTFSVSSTDVLITHDEPFTAVYPGAAVSNLSATGLDKIITKTRGESQTSLRVEFIDVTTGLAIDPTTLYGTGSYFNVIHHGYKIG